MADARENSFELPLIWFRQLQRDAKIFFPGSCQDIASHSLCHDDAAIRFHFDAARNFVDAKVCHSSAIHDSSAGYAPSCGDTGSDLTLWAVIETKPAPSKLLKGVARLLGYNATSTMAARSTNYYYNQLSEQHRRDWDFWYGGEFSRPLATVHSHDWRRLQITAILSSLVSNHQFVPLPPHCPLPSSRQTFRTTLPSRTRESLLHRCRVPHAKGLRHQAIPLHQEHAQDDARSVPRVDVGIR
jgi:hypothetical protein